MKNEPGPLFVLGLMIRSAALRVGPGAALRDQPSSGLIESRLSG